MNARYCPRGNCPHPLRERGRHCASDFGQHHVWCAALPPHTSCTTETHIAFFDLYPLTRPFCCMLVFGYPTDSGLVGKLESRLGPAVGAVTDVPRRLRAGPRSTGTNRRLGGLSCDNHRLSSLSLAPFELLEWVTCFEKLRTDFNPAWRLKKKETFHERYFVSSSADVAGIRCTGKSWGRPLSASSWLDGARAAISQRKASPSSAWRTGKGLEGPKVASQ